MFNPVLNYEFGKSRRTFVSIWKTDNTSTGSSNNNQIKLPLHSSGTYNFYINWGDGTEDHITTWNQAETTHTYSSIGTYTIRIRGIITGWSFSDGGDKLKILSVNRWGALRLGNIGNYFEGCSNLTLDTVSDVLNLSGISSFTMAFKGCSSITTINRVNEWNTSSITSMAQCFLFCSNFNQNISSWVTNSVGTFSQMFYGCTNFNSPLNTWVVSNAANMFEMFRNAIAFNQDISSWNISNVNNLTGFMQGKTSANYSTTNYNALLNAWSLLTVQPNLTPNFGTINYTAAASSARAVLTGAPNNWTITDGGLV